MRGRMRLTGIIAVVLVVALGLGFTFKLLDTPANADANQDVTSQDLIEEWPAFAAFREALEKCAVDTVEIDGCTYGVLENGETFGPGYPTSNYGPDYVTAQAKDGTTRWYKDADWQALPWPNNPTEVWWAGAHPETYTIPWTYELPGGEVYDYYEVTVGGVDQWDTTGAKYVILTLMDGSMVEIPWEDYEADPSILDQYDMKYLITSASPLKVLQAIGWDEPYTEEEWADPEGKYIIFKLADGGLADAPLAEYNEDPDRFQSQYQIVSMFASKRSLAELEELGVADLLFPHVEYPEGVF